MSRNYSAPATPRKRVRADITRTVAVIGGNGRMGVELARRLGAAGHAVSGVDRTQRGAGPPALDPHELASALGASDFVLLAVPITALPGVLELAAPYLKPRQVLFDIASVKEPALRCMEAYHAGPVVGAHPLFGPHARPADLRVALVPGRRADEDACGAVERLFADIGCTCFRVTAEEHDRNVGLIQSLNFACSAAYLAQAARSADSRFFTPSFRRRMESARFPLTEDAAMFGEFSAANPYFTEILTAYADALRGITASENGRETPSDLIRKRLADLARQAAGIYGDR
ncbi:MAG: prephenate dehydrogenase [Desulfovibrio sp.]|jgi:prephenate dehydrogenase|nr:prephenate dehydrogenase [Desulfovibrio sp.]